MGSIGEISHLCRLCLVKEQVNIPIFEEQGDIRQIFLKICSCLPVKITKEDSLPKKICDGCSQKLDSFYQFWKESSNSEKQLLAWLNNSNFDVNTITNQAVLTNSNKSSDTLILKQEIVDINDSKNEGSSIDYLLQQQQLPYQQNFNRFSQQEANATVTSEVDLNDEPPPAKRKKRAAPTKKRAKSTSDSEEDDDLDAVEAKVEGGDSDDSDNENDNQDPDYIDDSSHLDDQPGPSGVTKNLEAPSLFQDHLYAVNFNIPSLQPSNDNMSCIYFTNLSEVKQTPDISDVNNILTSDVDQFNQSETELLKFLSAEDDCNEILNNFTTNDHFEQLTDLVPLDIECLISKETKEMYQNEISCVSSSNIVQNKFTCNQCNKSYSSKKVLKKHLVTHLGVRNFSCDICGKSFKFAYEVNVHKKSHNNPSFQCDICSRMFTHKSNLTIHRRSHLGEYVSFCHECNKGFLTNTSYKLHINNYHSNLQLVCDICGARLSSHSSLKEHKETHLSNKKKLYTCEICGKNYMNTRSLKTHTKIHNNIRTYVCNICGKSVSGKKILETHVKMHTGVKDFICTVCGKAFASQEYLKLHNRTHTGEKPFECLICGKKFTQKTSLTVHTRTHTGQRPYKCECGKEFSTKSHLMTHYKSHDIGGVDIEYISQNISD